MAKHRIGASWLSLLTPFLFLLLEAQCVHATDLEFFEKNIRPVLVDSCYKCHGGDPKKFKGGYDLTSQAGIRSGGDSGPGIVPGDPESSLLMHAIRYSDPLLQMPPDGKLDESVIRDFETWIRDGAPDPRVEQPEGSPLAEETTDPTSWAETLKQRLKWWSFQPLQSPDLPSPADENWNHNSIDRFVRAGLEYADLEPSLAADVRTLVRRLYFVLIGLPPSPEEIAAFISEFEIDPQTAVEQTADRLIASERFGERWARHWMDWVRYAETHGSEGDPAIPFAWRYRDYLIRALNADVPYDDLVREHIAGDLIESPRIDAENGINESALGIGHYRFVLHGFAPTDPLDEQVRFTENQIDVISKAFLSTTVACARCHDHKFDPISQKDYYAFYGIMASCRPATITVDTPERRDTHREQLKLKKSEIRKALSDLWISQSDRVPELLKSSDGPWGSAIDNATVPMNPLHAWQRLRRADTVAFRRGWDDLLDSLKRSQAALGQREKTEYPVHWRLGTDDAKSWNAHGTGVSQEASPAGEFSILHEGPHVIRGIYPAGVYSHLLSTRHNGSIASPRIELADQNLYIRVLGDYDPVARYVIRNYPRDGTVYPILKFNGGDWSWQHWDVGYWSGEIAHVEISTALDQPVLIHPGMERSWFGVTEVIAADRGQPAPRDEAAEFLAPLFEGNRPENPDALAERYRDSIKTSITAWAEGSMSDSQARYLDHFLKSGLLPNSIEGSEELKELTSEYRRLEAEVPVPTRAPGILEGEPIDQPLFVRGNHKTPAEPVARRFLEGIDPRPFDTQQSGRLELAESIVRPDNPLTARVIVNRLWHHVFGKGIVATPDDFGVMGEQPTHPELLDHLASDMISGEWSIKRMIREMVTSQTFRLSSLPTAKAAENDPANDLLSHANLRRLEAEAIRDTLLAVSGRLKLGEPAGSADDQSRRRSVYLRVIRNSPNSFLSTFDMPSPTTTRGRRDATNVPAQSLTMMNDPLIRALAVSFAELYAADAQNGSEAGLVAELFEAAIGRIPGADEVEAMIEYLETVAERPVGIEQDEELAVEYKKLAGQRKMLESEIASRLKKIPSDADVPRNEEGLPKREAAGEKLVSLSDELEKRMEELESRGNNLPPATDLAQAIFSLKEFIYLR